MSQVLPPLVEEKLRSISHRVRELEQLMASPEVAADSRAILAHGRELGELSRSATLYEEYRKVAAELEENEALARDTSEDPEMRELAREELEPLRTRREELVEQLIDLVLVDDRFAARSVIVEIRAGTGGDEAALFVADLFRMYSRYSDKRGWKLDILDSSPTALKGFKEIMFSLSGDSVGRDMRYEMGGHRVQRVPETESQGRIHTSAVTVAVMPEAEEVDVEIDEKDLEIDFFRASGPGGQKVNKTSSAVRLRHVPSGLVVSIQDESSQHKNRARAMKVLRSRLLEQRESERASKEQDLRRGQIGSGDRNQRIRTYNYPQNRVTDHRIGENFNLDRILIEGDLSPVIDVLRGHDREEQLRNL